MRTQFFLPNDIYYFLPFTLFITHFSFYFILVQLILKVSRFQNEFILKFTDLYYVTKESIPDSCVSSFFEKIAILHFILIVGSGPRLRFYVGTKNSHLIFARLAFDIFFCCPRIQRISWLDLNLLTKVKNMIHKFYVC